MKQAIFKNERIGVKKISKNFTFSNLTTFIKSAKEKILRKYTKNFNFEKWAKFFWEHFKHYFENAHKNKDSFFYNHQKFFKMFEII